MSPCINETNCQITYVKTSGYNVIFVYVCKLPLVFKETLNKLKTIVQFIKYL